MSTAAASWDMRKVQLASVFRLELRRHFFRLRGFWIYLMAFGPAMIIVAHAISVLSGFSHCSLEEDAQILAGIFQLYYLHLGIFFGCMGIFTRLFRGDMVERSLHYYFLAPVRREVLVLAKFLAGLAAATFCYGSAVTVAVFAMYGHHGEQGKAFLSQGPGMAHYAAYLGVTLLACAGYGALFLLMGMLYKNPIIPAVVILLWESINNILPSMLKKLSVIFYLIPLCPVDVPVEGLPALFTVSTEPVPAYLAVPGVLMVAAALLALACYKVRSAEIRYGGE